MEVKERTISKDGRRPGDLQFPEFFSGLTVDVDVTIATNLCPSYVKKGPYTPSELFKAAKDTKNKTYDSFYKENKDIFEERRLMVFSMDTFGNFSEEAHEVITQLAICRAANENTTIVNAEMEIKQFMSAKLAQITGTQLTKVNRKPK